MSHYKYLDHNQLCSRRTPSSGLAWELLFEPTVRIELMDNMDILMKKIALISSLAFCIGLSVQGQDTTYTWQGGAPGFSGTLVLDAPSSPLGGGSASDIVSWQLTTPIGGTVTLYPGVVGPVDPTFTWNSSQITEMAIEGIGSGSFGNVLMLAGQNYFGSGLNLVAVENLNGFQESDTTGSWKAAVPDGGSTVALLGVALAGLGAVRRFRQ